MMSSILRTLIIAATLISACLGAESPTIAFDRGLLQIGSNPDGRGTVIDYPGTEPIAVSPGLTLSGYRVVIPLETHETITMIRAEVGIGAELSTISIDAPADIPTSDDESYSRAITEQATDSRLGESVLEFSGEYEDNYTRYAAVMLLPVTRQDNALVFTEDLRVYVGDRLVTSSQLLNPSTIPQHDITGRTNNRSGLQSLAPEYVIITSNEMAPVLQRLAAYKSMTGFRTQVIAVEDITALYSGRDGAEQVREYLKTFYAEGGCYVLLAGDETIVPIRYAYPYNVSTSPPPDLLQVCDLYYADLTGEWNRDNDDTWGERTQDAPDLIPELLVGRLPLCDSTEFEAYIDKLITYETDPGSGDRAYLGRTLFYSSDQMRDYVDGGQHATVAGAFPDSFEIDTSLAVEHSSGDDPAPDNTVPNELKAAMHGGFGIVHIIAHGRSDGFVVRSSGYNEWPKLYLLATPQNGAQGSLDSIGFVDKPSFYYSLACNNGAFDYDHLPLGESPTMVQNLMGATNGAVGMVAYSRWGWVNSSHLLQRAFFDSLFAHPDRPAVEAMNAAKHVYYYYRDLVFGQNFYGDPTLRIHAGVPEELEVEVHASPTSLEIAVSNGTGSVSNIHVILCELDGSLVAETYTDASGQASLTDYDPLARHVLSLVHPDYLIEQIEVDPSFVTDVDEDPDSGLPGEFSLSQNYPNPFNPTTRIAYALPTGGNVVLEIFNALGQRVDQPVNAEQAAGEYELEWNASDPNGRELASGVYFYRLQAGETTIVRKMILAR